MVRVRVMLCSRLMVRVRFVVSVRVMIMVRVMNRVRPASYNYFRSRSSLNQQENKANTWLCLYLLQGLGLC